MGGNVFKPFLHTLSSQAYRARLAEDLITVFGALSGRAGSALFLRSGSDFGVSLEARQVFVFG
ncbi:hypothetical protein AB0J81_14525 [Streptomyces bobili]|uniref:hypothetical protein n=1 Tax=Streptomyces bobili TaxID=67280 RepID=UPI0034276AE7